MRPRRGIAIWFFAFCSPGDLLRPLVAKILVYHHGRQRMHVVGHYRRSKQLLARKPSWSTCYAMSVVSSKSGWVWLTAYLYLKAATFFTKGKQFKALRLVYCLNRL